MRIVAIFVLLVGIAWSLGAAVPAGAHTLRYDGTPSGDDHDGHQHRDDMFGYQGDDVLRGWADQDFIRGGEGDDELYGNRGADILVGGRGVDVLWGGKGNDFLTDTRTPLGVATVFRCGDGFDFIAVPDSWQAGVEFLAFGCEVRDRIIPDPPPKS